MKPIINRGAIRERVHSLIARGVQAGIERGWIPQSYNPYNASSQINYGGLVNPTSGMGTVADKANASFFIATRIHWRGELDVLYNQSWAAAKFIDIPVDDMLARWRVWDTTQDEQAAQAMQACEERLKVRSKLARAMKAGRLYGTGLCIIVSREAPLDQALRVEQIRPGDVVALHVFDRYNASVLERDMEINSPTFNQPLVYWITPKSGRAFRVHHSRVLRFDGKKPLTDDGFTLYDLDWGVSEIIAVITTILQDESMAAAIAHLIQEASLPVLRVDGLKDVLVGGQDPDDPTPEQIADKLNQMKSVFRVLMMDKTDEFDRIHVQFGGIKDVQDQMARRLAAAADIPMTRMWGQSPLGMNATGESDEHNYDQRLNSNREHTLADPLMALDDVLTADAGIGEAPKYMWPPRLEPTEEQQAQIALHRAQALQIATSIGAMDEDEARQSLDGNPVFGSLPGEAPGLPEPDLPPESGGGGNSGE